MALIELLQPYISTTSFITIILVLSVSILIRRRPGSTLPLPPGPWKLPLIGNLHQLISDMPHHRLRDLAQKHGPHLMHLQLGELSYMIISSSESARQVLKAHDLNFANRPRILATEIVFYGGQDIGFSPYGEHWRQMRKICVMELLSAKRVASFRQIRESEVSKLTAAISRSAGESTDVGRLVGASSSGFTFRAAFGMATEMTNKEATFMGLIADIVNATGGFRVSDLFPSLKFLPALTGYRSYLTRMHVATDAILQDIVDDHKARRERRRRRKSSSEAVDTSDEDLVDVLLKLQEGESPDLEFPLTTEAVKAVILDMFLAGIETSSTTVEWTMSELMRNPNAMQKVQEELRSKFGGKKKVDEDYFHDLTYLDLVIQESLRLHPPLPLLLPREARERVEILGYEIPTQTKAIINVWAIGRDPRYWEEADKFIPERFLNRPSDYTGKGFEFMPFGSGRRMCPGLSFGLASVKLILANLLYHFDWQLPSGVTSENLDMTERFGAGVRRKHGLHLIPIVYDVTMP